MTKYRSISNNDIHTRVSVSSLLLWLEPSNWRVSVRVLSLLLFVVWVWLIYTKGGSRCLTQTRANKRGLGDLFNTLYEALEPR
jgi:hypothetical protein